MIKEQKSEENRPSQKWPFWGDLHPFWAISKKKDQLKIGKIAHF